MDVHYDLPPDLPTHRETPLEPHPAQVLTTWPLGTFVENLIVRRIGEIVVSVHSESRLETIDLDGARRILARLPAPPTSLIEARDDLFVTRQPLRVTSPSSGAAAWAGCRGAGSN